ncbi:MAG: STAS domain-containing protein [Clostridia bacterium]|nr:STAS domain-containing protein [Clostridia bacterium]
MTIEMKKNGSALTVSLAGRLDTVTSPDLEKALADALADVKELTFDLAKLEYVSSAGLRVLLSAQKKMSVAGKMVVKNVSETVNEIFEVTGFSDILTIE